MILFQRKGNENKSETKQELEELRSRQINKSSNVVKVRQELTGNAIMTKAETNESSWQDVKTTEPVYDTLETPEENSTNKITGKLNFNYLYNMSILYMYNYSLSVLFWSIFLCI